MRSLAKPVKHCLGIGDLKGSGREQAMLLNHIFKETVDEEEKFKKVVIK